MKNTQPFLNKTTLLALAVAMPLSAPVFAAEAAKSSAQKNSAMKNSDDVIIDLRLRQESVSDSTNDDASALTLRSRLGYQTAAFAGFKALAEIEDVRALTDDYAPKNAGFAVVADPENTEINRAQISYQYSSDAAAKEATKLNAILGRQRIILDNARFVGNVGWRQNEQTFDALTLKAQQGDLTLHYSFIDQVNGILRKFDADVSNHLLHLSFGDNSNKINAFAYLLENDDSEAKNNTFGARYNGAMKIGEHSLIYQGAIATQSTEAPGADDYSALYYQLEGGAKISGVTLAAGIETLGSDDGNYGFQTPLATKHAYNGWADKFLATPANGLQDIYLKAATKLSGVKLAAFYHDYSADQGSDKYGSEFDLVVAKKIDKNFSLGLKAAFYQADTHSTDTDKIWFWGQAKF